MVADELEDLLLKEHQALLAGRLLDLKSIASRKVTLFEALNSAESVSPKQLQRVSTMAARNAALLLASGRGIKAAIRQIEEASVLSDQNFYGPDGQRRSLVSSPEKLQQKL